MKVLKSIEEINQTVIGPIVLAIGNFDGCHKGHSDLLKCLLEKEKKYKATAVLLTFNPHPLIYFNKEATTLLDTPKEKLRKLEELGIKYLLEIDFTSKIQSLSAEDFIRHFILGLNKISFILLGHDFALGNGKKPAKNLLLELVKDDLEVGEMSSFIIGGEVISSSLIRSQIMKGELEKANSYLEEKFSITGKVVRGRGNGRKHLVATANIEVPKYKILPGRGVYFTTCYLGQKKHISITNIGSNPTIGDVEKLSVESHLLDFDESIYGEELKIIFHKKCRNEIKFDDLHALKAEINKNIASRRLFKC